MTVQPPATLPATENAPTIDNPPTNADTIDGAAPAPAPTDNSLRGNSRWRTWEIGYLLEMVADGKTAADLAIPLERSAAACERMLARLAAGEHPCPADFANSLAKVRTIFSPKLPNARTPGHQAALDRINAQYRAMSATLAETRDLINAVDTGQLHGLACQIIAGEITPAEVSRFLGPKRALAAAALAAEVEDYRHRPTPTTPPTSPAPDAPVAAADLPLVHTGHTRDLRFPPPRTEPETFDDYS